MSGRPGRLLEDWPAVPTMTDVQGGPLPIDLAAIRAAAEVMRAEWTAECDAAGVGDGSVWFAKAVDPDAQEGLGLGGLDRTVDVEAVLLVRRWRRPGRGAENIEPGCGGVSIGRDAAQGERAVGVGAEIVGGASSRSADTCVRPLILLISGHVAEMYMVLPRGPGGECGRESSHPAGPHACTWASPAPAKGAEIAAGEASPGSTATGPDAEGAPRLATTGYLITVRKSEVVHGE